ncbi:MAG: 50S ribosomal protein L4 [Nanoarchaeota archaeon]
MKATNYDLKGQKTSEINLPGIFATKIREDIALKYYEADKEFHPYAPSPLAGRKHSASGTISHRRHEWKGHYGKGISRAPRKAMWRRGTQFYWVGAEVNYARGGRAVHAPKIFYRPRKINDNEIKIAMHSAIASTAKKEIVTKRYTRLNDFAGQVPFVISNAENIKTKQLIEILKKMLGDKYEVALQVKNVRSGKGKMRNRKYKSTAGLLFVKAKNEKINIKGVDVVNANELSIADLFPLGRLTLYTEKSLAELK